MAKLLLIIGFLMAFGAGVLIGPKFRREAAAAPATKPSHQGSWLTTELNLTPDQQEQMKKIWSDTARRGNREQEDRRRQFRKDRDDAIAALISPPDREKYDQVLKTYGERNAAMDREWRSSYLAAVERTKQILTVEQRNKYEELLKNREAEHAARERDTGRRVDDRATSRPGPEK
jgi:Spy/CpxP family protein refolding chaperone